ncbi:MAG: nuclease PIN [Myxococcota bacterium]
MIKSNAFEIRCPQEVFEVRLARWPESGAWQWIREKTKNRNVVAVPYKGRVLALGDASEIRSIFGQQLMPPVSKTPIAEHELRYEDGAVTSLMLSAIVQSLASKPGLQSDGRRVLWLKERDRTQSIGGTTYDVHEAAQIYLRRVAATHHLVIKPSVRVLTQNGERTDRDVEDRIRMKILGYQHNAKFNQAMERWRSRLLADTAGRLAYPPGSKDGFEFIVHRAPQFAALRTRGNARKAPTITPKLEKHIRQFGFELPEPKLTFSTPSGLQVSDVHPIRGIVKNRPYDYALSDAGIAPSVRLGIVCPAKDSQQLSEFLNASRDTLRRSESERDYLLDFPGFHNAWGVPLEIPSPGEEGWIELSDPPADASSQAGTTELARSVTSAIDALRASHSPCIALVHIPDRFERWKRFETTSERLDLHDFTKAHCVPRGMSSQFLEEHTLRDPQRCRVWWWLSLALYVKSMRTPWVLDSLDDDTAYVGLGFSVDSKAKRGNHVVLGCSHIYNSRGEGLQYRLTKIEDPTIRQGNPFMSRDDSRRVGDTIRQLFYESHLALPSRVVVHKRTSFQRDEREGLLEGLGGVDEVDMLEINVDPALRYVASKTDRSGQIREDNYPVDRGSVVKLDDHTALAWVHGVAEALDPRLKYYQGKRRIPAPLVIRRAAGASDLETLCAEILGLSKMDWNSFDLYTRLPSTIGSSSRIARIGSLLERFGSSAYDYRLFI